MPGRIVWHLILGWLFVALPLFAQSHSKVLLIFYSSESNVTNYNTLKKSFETYFTDKGELDFQPFSELATFERFLSDKQVDLVMLSSWHYQNLAHAEELLPILVGRLGDQTAQKRILVGTARPKKGKKLSVATAGSEDFAQTLLKRMNHSFPPDRLELLVVPKDIDALMSVGFGIADMALTTETSLTKLESVNPKLAQSLVRISTSEQVLLPVIAIRGSAKAQAQQILKAFESMGNTAEGKTTLKILGLDGWKRLSDTERGALKL